MTDSLLALDRVRDPCALVIFGASDDLTRRKLVPAIWQLAQQGRLPERFALVGVARSEMSVDDF
ncbi:MAG: glucose-6-phosphate dehydrogenase, partial [Candidatus Latescibacterota bacterium]